MSRSAAKLDAPDDFANLKIGPQLRRVREAAGLSQSALAGRIGMHQAALSRLEQQGDVLVSTLAAYVSGVGASLKILAQLNNDLFGLAGQSNLTNETTASARGCLNYPPQPSDERNRDVVFSIKPQYSESILDGVKTVELRRRFPRKIASGTLAFIYTTTPIRALTGLAEIEDVIERSPNQIWKEFSGQACISRTQFRSYFSGVPSAFAIKLRDARRLRRPIELAELRERFSFEPPQSFLYAQPRLREALQYECAELPHRHECLYRT